jgi:hypothetical protein
MNLSDSLSIPGSIYRCLATDHDGFIILLILKAHVLAYKCEIFQA